MQEPSARLDHLAKRIIGAAIEVHKCLGPGYLESIYEHALAHELELRGISYQRQVAIGIEYKGKNVGNNRLDFLVDGRLIVEIKSVEQLLPLHSAQVISYLKAYRVELGLLINFNSMLLKQGIKRIVYSN